MHNIIQNFKYLSKISNIKYTPSAAIPQLMIPLYNQFCFIENKLTEIIEVQKIDSSKIYLETQESHYGKNKLFFIKLKEDHEILFSAEIDI